MNPIKLTEEHKTKLLEMCKVLFPEYKKIDWYIDGDGNDDYDILIIKDEMPYILIHWFEFCMTHLVEKIFNPNPDKIQRGLQEKFKEFFWRSNIYWERQRAIDELKSSVKNPEKHPVDYLYEEFKKLKS